MRQIAAALLALLLALPAAAALAGALPPPPVVPQVRVELEQVPPVDVDRDLDAVISTNGSVNVSVPAWVTVETHVYLNVTVNNSYWFATIDPPSATFVGSGEVFFKVNVTVPGRVAIDAGAEIYVDANVSVTPGFGRSWTAATPIPIIQYFGVTVTPATGSSPANFSATAGTDTAFGLQIRNLGNGRDSFDLHVDNIGELQAAGISVFLPSPVSVPAKVTANVNGNVTVPASLSSGNFTITVSAFSTGAAAKGVSITAGGEKRLRVLPPEPTDGGNDGTGGNGTPPGGFLPGLGSAETLVAVGAVAALVATRRLRRP